MAESVSQQKIYLLYSEQKKSMYKILSKCFSLEFTKILNTKKLWSISYKLN